MIKTTLIAGQAAAIAVLLLHADSIEGFGLGLLLGLCLGVLVGAAFVLGWKESHDVHP